MTLSITTLCWVSLFIYCYAKCHFTESRYAECHYDECRYAECHYGESCGAWLKLAVLGNCCSSEVKWNKINANKQKILSWLPSPGKLLKDRSLWPDCDRINEKTKISWARSSVRWKRAIFEKFPGLGSEPKIFWLFLFILFHSSSEPLWSPI